MASSKTPPPFLWQGVQIVPDSNVTLEEVLLAVGEQVEHDNLSFASPMNKAVVVFLKDKVNKFHLTDSGVFIKDTVVPFRCFLCVRPFGLRYSDGEAFQVRECGT